METGMRIYIYICINFVSLFRAPLFRLFARDDGLAGNTIRVYPIEWSTKGFAFVRGMFFPSGPFNFPKRDVHDGRDSVFNSTQCFISPKTK